MKLQSIFKAILLLCFLAMSSKILAQKKGHSHPPKHRHAKRAAVRRSAYRPAKVVVFHPAWRPKHSYYRRWVYFPKYNIYWDNWRSHYVFLNGATWVSQAAAPPIIVNVNLENEKSKELKEEEDDNDDIYLENDMHKK